MKNYLGSRRITNLDYGPLIKKVGNGCRKIHTINNLGDLRRKNCGKSNAAVKAGNHSCCGVVKFWGNYVGYRYIYTPPSHWGWGSVLLKIVLYASSQYRRSGDRDSSV